MIHKTEIRYSASQSIIHIVGFTDNALYGIPRRTSFPFTENWDNKWFHLCKIYYRPPKEKKNTI